MPAACNNIPNLRVAFVWQNDNDANATDPSFAVDNVVITDLTILPVSLLNYQATLDEKNIVTNQWSTVTELNNNIFEILKSEDGSEWNKITEVKGKNQKNELSTYTIKDPSPIYKTTYYKLQQIDNDGSKKELGVRFVNPNKPNLDWELYPNPSEGKLFIKTLKRSQYRLEAINSVGEKFTLKQFQTINENLNEFDISDLANGYYSIALYINGSVYFKKLIKEPK